MSFRAILLSVILGLILAATVSTTWLGAAGFTKAIRELVKRQIDTSLDAVTGQVEDLFAPTERILESLSTHLRNGTLATEDPVALAKALADILVFEQGIAWISFGYPDGSFAGAHTNGDGVTINVSEPGEGTPREWTIGPLNQLTPVTRPGLPANFDARDRVWFRLASDAEGLIWTPPYNFASGGRGITVSKAVRADDGSLIGVVTVDFLLQDVVDYLEALKGKFDGDTLVFSLHGKVIATPKVVRSAAAVEEVRRLLTAKIDEPGFREGGGRMLLELSAGGQDFFIGAKGADVPGDLDCYSIIIMDRQVALGAMEEIISRSALAALIALTVSLGAGFFLAGRIANPLGVLSSQLARIGNFDLRPAPEPRSPIREVQTLSEAIARMRTGIQSFSHYVPVHLVRDLIRSGGVAELGASRRQVTILFSDLAGFTSFAEKSTPEVAMEALTTYFDGVGEAIHENSGVIDKFLGDGIMALFGAPAPMEHPEAAACRAALKGVAVLTAEDSGPRAALDVRFGIFSGEALVGNVGTAKRFAYTAIGDCVNLCSRLEGLNKHYGTRILTGTDVRQAAGETEFLWRRLDRVAVAGRTEPLDIHELICLRTDAATAQTRLANDYSDALDHFIYQRLEEATAILETLAPNDTPSRILLDRIHALQSDPEAPGWDGIQRFKQK